jgi:hypothetical protein
MIQDVVIKEWNNKGRNKINKFVQYSGGDYILCMMYVIFAVHSFCLLKLLTLTCFPRIPMKTMYVKGIY